MPQPLVSVLMGSRSDLAVMEKAAAVLREFGVPHEVRVLSAHRSSKALEAHVEEAAAGGVEVFICAAGMAAHLAGAVAARTTLPVIGVPLSASLNGLDALLSTVQMPPGIPVATVAVDGAKNSAYLAISILALKRPDLTGKLHAFREQMAREIESNSMVSGDPPPAGGVKPPAAGGRSPAGAGQPPGKTPGGTPS
jgi:phosphoribosylaminoimidazole carboxylase PurE protein